MNSKNRNSNGIHKRETKKAAVLGTGKKRRPPAYALAAMGLLVVVGAVYAYMHLSDEGGTVATNISSVANATQIALPVNLFDNGMARHYEYRDGNIAIKYFVIKSSDGIIRAAFDACDVCWPAGKGYYQSGDVMVCRNCGRQFKSVLVNEVKGGCNPAPLKRSIENGQLIIQVKDILEGKQYFNFSGKA